MKGWLGVEQRPAVSKDFKEHPWIFRCPKPNCYYAVSSTSEEEIRKQEATHNCPYQGGITHLAGSITVTLVEDMWAKADAAYAAMQEDNLTPDEANRRKGVVRGMCEMIAIFMVPHFHTGNEIGRELVKRSAMAASSEAYETVGLGGRRYEYPDRDDKYKGALKSVAEGDKVIQLSTGHSGTVKRIDEDGILVEYDKGGFGLSASTADFKAAVKVALSPAAFKLTNDEVKAIKFASSSGFSATDIAKTYNITAADVKQIISN